MLEAARPFAAETAADTPHLIGSNITRGGYKEQVRGYCRDAQERVPVMSAAYLFFPR